MPVKGYAWIIDKDHLFDPRLAKMMRDDAGTKGPRDADPDLVTLLALGYGHRFQMFDDDDELYYEGRIVWSADHDGPNVGFEPLEDFGQPNAGCTGIKYPDSGPDLGGGKYL